jgi:hypothetical protein
LLDREYLRGHIAVLGLISGRMEKLLKFQARAGS